MRIVKKCFGRMDDLTVSCTDCRDSTDCLLETISNRAVHEKLNTHRFDRVANVFTVKNASNYEGLEEGDVVAVLSEIDNVVLVTVKDKECEYLMKKSDLTPLYKVSDLFVDTEGYTEAVYTDLCKRVVVDMYTDRYSSEGIAICCDQDEFDFDFGYALAVTRAQMELLKLVEKDLINFSM